MKDPTSSPAAQNLSLKLLLKKTFLIYLFAQFTRFSLRCLFKNCSSIALIFLINVINMLNLFTVFTLITSVSNIFLMVNSILLLINFLSFDPVSFCNIIKDSFLVLIYPKFAVISFNISMITIQPFHNPLCCIPIIQ